jgi:formate hydrogenlyase subunit 3/multisubunit Na+/H+ antiporter MnhD subunit
LRATFSLLLVLCSTAIETVTTDARTHRGITKKITNLFFFPFVISLLVAPLCPFETFSSKWERREALGKHKKFGRLKETVCCFFYCSVQKAQHSRLERNQTEFK